MEVKNQILMLKIACAAMLVFVVQLFIAFAPWEKTEKDIDGHIVYRSFCGEELLPFSNQENFTCMEWALGSNFLSLPVLASREKWAELHPKLPQFKKDDWPERFFEVVASEWRKLEWKQENSTESQNKY